jgi:hypothetical protein
MRSGGAADRLHQATAWGGVVVIVAGIALQQGKHTQGNQTH